MSQFVSTRTRTFTSGVSLLAHRLVRLSTGKLAYNGASDTDLVGATLVFTAAADLPTAVALRNLEGTVMLTASAAISIGASVYGAANGKVAASGTVLIGVALQAASGDDAIIEVLPSTNTAFGTVGRSNLLQDDLAPLAIPLDTGRVWDAIQTNLPGTAATDDIAIITGTFGTAAPVLQGVDFGGTTTTAHARFRVPVPVEYVAGETINLRINAGMITSVSDTTATVDAVVYRVAAPTVDVCSTAAQTINSLTAANKDFVLTPTNVVPGDILDIRVTIAGADTANAAPLIPQINSIAILLDIKG